MSKSEIFFCLLFFPVFNGCTQVEHVHTICSEHNEYCLEIFREKMYFAMPGQGSDHMATIILKDQTGRILDKITSKSNPDRSIMLRDVEVRWKLEENQIWYGKARYFEVKKN